MTRRERELFEALHKHSERADRAEVQLKAAQARIVELENFHACFRHDKQGTLWLGRVIINADAEQAWLAAQPTKDAT